MRAQEHEREDNLHAGPDDERYHLGAIGQQTEQGCRQREEKQADRPTKEAEVATRSQGRPDHDNLTRRKPGVPPRTGGAHGDRPNGTFGSVSDSNLTRYSAGVKLGGESRTS